MKIWWRQVIPLLRGQLGMRTLHPLVETCDLVWCVVRDNNMESNFRAYTSEPQESWLRSPTYWMLTERVMELRQKLSDEATVERHFPIFDEFKRSGASDYYAFLIPFGAFESAEASHDGAMISWLSDAKEGFSPSDIEILRKAKSYLGLVAKLFKRESTARNVATAYHGKDAGQRVLKGQIRLGDVERIPAIVWFSDLRNSTALAEKMSAEDFL